ncbi:LLM class flavin-dependent oxidoreductase [Nocardiopsis kunsanensis]|nr:LLM class flavin-dependent oxidoreductase [Nocardiopsis kunsanensis]
MKRIGFLSFGHWTPSPRSQVRSASDTLLQSIDLAVAAEELGADGAYFRVRHFARQLASPFPLLTEDTGVPFHQLQAEQIQDFREAWSAAGHRHQPRVSVSRSIFPLVSTFDRQLFGREKASTDQVGHLEEGPARFGKTYAGEPDELVEKLAGDEAVATADTLLITVPNQLGVDYNAHIIENLLRHVAPGLGRR